MKQTLLIVLILSTMLICFSCVKKNNSMEITHVNIEAAANKMTEIYLSQISNNIKYVPLEFTIENPLGRIDYLDVSDKYILASDGITCLLFDINGHFIRKIGKQGRGPGEYKLINGDVLVNNKIYIRDICDLLEFDVNGLFLKKYKDCFMIDGKYFLPEYQTVMINDSVIFGYIENSTGNVKFRAAVLDKTGKVQAYFKNFSTFNPEPGKHGAKRIQRASIHKFGNRIFYIEPFCDTLYILTDQYKLVPGYIFDFGKFGEPPSERTKPVEEYDALEYFHLSNVLQTGKYLFINCIFGHHFPAKRIHPETIPLPNGKVFIRLYNTYTVLGIFDKENHSLVFSKPADTDNHLSTSGLNNDVDAGPWFMPDQMINDSTMVMILDSEYLKVHVLSEDFKNNNPKVPGKKKRFEVFVDSLIQVDNNNPVLMIVTFKK